MFFRRKATNGSLLKRLCVRRLAPTVSEKSELPCLSTQSFLPVALVRQPMLFRKKCTHSTQKGGESVTLRPEGTAGAARAVLEHALENEGLPIKASYFVSCYRYEKPQAGRLREFHQFGIEEYGTQDPVADAELISLVSSVINRLQIDSVHLQINSIGCPTCRAEYHKALKSYFEGYKDKLCDTCLSVLTKTR